MTVQGTARHRHRELRGLALAGREAIPQSKNVNGVHKVHYERGQLHNMPTAYASLAKTFICFIGYIFNICLNPSSS